MAFKKYPKMIDNPHIRGHRIVVESREHEKAVNDGTVWPVPIPPEEIPDSFKEWPKMIKHPDRGNIVVGSLAEYNEMFDIQEEKPLYKMNVKELKAKGLTLDLEFDGETKAEMREKIEEAQEKA